MDISQITKTHDTDLSIRQLRAFQTLFDEQSLTQAAQVLNVTQPAMSKAMAKLRRYFDDPLFTRVGHRMVPTAKALEIQPDISRILSQLTSLKSQHVPFDPLRSSRTFRFCVVDAGIVRLLPPLIEHLSAGAPNVRFDVVQLDEQRLESELESGSLDFAMGSYPRMSAKIRCQNLWRLRYLSAVRREHPRIRDELSPTEYARERHVVVSTAGTGHAHRQAERAMRQLIPKRNIVATVPTFVTAAYVASETDLVVTLPAALLETLAPKLGLKILEPPITLPNIQISQHWHERFHREPGSVWVRQLFAELYSDRARAQLSNI